MDPYECHTQGMCLSTLHNRAVVNTVWRNPKLLLKKSLVLPGSLRFLAFRKVLCIVHTCKRASFMMRPKIIMSYCFGAQRCSVFAMGVIAHFQVCPWGYGVHECCVPLPHTGTPPPPPKKNKQQQQQNTNNKQTTILAYAQGSMMSINITSFNSFEF